MRDLTNLFQYVDEHFEDMYHDLETICSYRSVKGDEEGLEKTREFLLKKMEQAKIPVKKVTVENGNAVIYGHVKGKAEDTVLCYNHYDVVEEGAWEKWKSHNPYCLETIDGVMYARGISDNKGSLLSRIHAVETILAVEGELPASIKFFFEGDEETGSPSMFRLAKEEEELFREMTKADVCLWENGRKDEDGHPWARFGVRGNCAFDLRVTTAKSDVHGRMGATIPSASWRLLWALASLKDVNERIRLEGFYEDVIPPTEADRKVLKDFPYEEEAIRKRLGIKEFLLGATGNELKERVYLEPSLSVCGIEAGELYNGPRGIVPRTAWARLSFYLVAGQRPERVEMQLREHLKKHGFEDVEVVPLGGGTVPVKTPVDIPFRERVCRAASHVYEKPMVIEPTQLGAGPASAFRDAWSELPIVGIGPANTAANHHAPNENMLVEDYKEAVKLMIALLYTYEKQEDWV